MHHPNRNALSKVKAFTLVELLVVIGIIAVLIGILIPVLGKAREQANVVKCLSNIRQLAMSSMLFSADHHDHIPTCTTDQFVKQVDTYRTFWDYRTSPTGPVVKDWASMLLPYLGGKNIDVYSFLVGNPALQSKIFICPSDEWQDLGGNSGYRLFNNVASPPGPASQYYPISYGINADIACLVDLTVAPPVGPLGRFDGSNIVAVYGGPGNGTYPAKMGVPYGATLKGIRHSSETLLYADCGTRPHTGTNPLDFSDSLYYTTNYDVYSPKGGGPLLSDMMDTPWLADRVPLKRHKDKINVVFTDGHAATILKAFFSQVRISPYNVQK